MAARREMQLDGMVEKAGKHHDRRSAWGRGVQELGKGGVA